MIDARNKVQTALQDYYNSNGTDINAGYNIMRYVEQNLIIPRPHLDSTRKFFEQYPLSPAYIFLQLARRGYLTIHPSLKDE